MADASPLWPARLHHIEIATPRPDALAEFYTRAFDYGTWELDEGRTLLQIGYRRLVLRRGEARGLATAAFAVESTEQLEALRGHLREQQVPLEAPPTPLFQEGAFAVRDPDGRMLSFGLPQADDDNEATTEVLIGRLQHVVVTTLDLEASRHFYEDVLGFALSDTVVREEDGQPTTYFFRSDPEHHSIAVFLSDSVRLDHHALDVPDWNAIRDWSDHLAALHIPIIWGPGRHGPGNNLFCMVEDPDGNMVEISAELEQLQRDVPPRQWPHNERSLNLWGPAIMRI